MGYGDLKTKIVYQELSYEIVGSVFEVYNSIGYGYPEKYYQKAVASVFKTKNINFKEQVAYNLKLNGEIIARNYLDFLVEDKVIVELKQGNHFSKNFLDQVKKYLKITDLKLAILVNFTSSGVKFLRVLNIN